MKKLFCLLIFVVFFSSSLSTAYSREEKKIGNRSFNNTTEVVQKDLEKEKKQGKEITVIPGPTGANGKKCTIMLIPGKDIDNGIFIPSKDIDNGILIGPNIPKDDIIVDLPEGSKVQPIKHEKDKK
jgi:hypothetical protein